MSKSALILFTIAFAVFLVAPVRAQENTTTNSTVTPSPRILRPNNATSETMEIKRELKPLASPRMTAEKREEITTRRSTKLAEECARVVVNASKFMEKIQERIDRAKVEGRDVQTAADALARARAALSAGQSYCEQAVATFDSIPTDEWTQQTTIITEARALARQAKESFVQMRRDLAEAVRAIRGLGLHRAEKTRENVQ